MSMMGKRWCVRAPCKVSYEVVDCPGVFDPGNPALLSVGRVEGGRRFVVVDENVYRHHGEQIDRYFSHHGISVHLMLLPGGEQNKSLDNWLAVLRELDTFPLHRRDEPVIAIGGGVITDLVGYAASCYRRGIPHIQVPTTLMGQVDAAVGVKTGINFNGHKNRLGSFAPPARVLRDTHLLTTLPVRHLRNGMAEIIKLAVIKDAGLFARLEYFGVHSLATAFQYSQGVKLIDTAITGMLDELSGNLFEARLARCVDFGHTFSYGLETRFADRLLHGEAVLLDILLSVHLACQRNLLAAAEVERVWQLVRNLGMAPDASLLDVERVWHALMDRIEHRNGDQQVPLPAGLGRCVFVNDLTITEVAKAIKALEISSVIAGRTAIDNTVVNNRVVASGLHAEGEPHRAGSEH